MVTRDNSEKLSEHSRSRDPFVFYLYTKYKYMHGGVCFMSGSA